jgi:hypothetical protein
MVDKDFEKLVDDGTEVTPDSNTQEVKPVKLGKGAVAGILMGILFIVAILILTVASCQVEKKENVSQNDGSVISSSTAVSEPVSNMGENSVKNEEQTTVFSEVATTSSENSKSANSQKPVENSQNSVVDSNSGLKEVALPAFGNELNSKGIVISKHVYSYEGSYIYGINVSVLIGDTTKTVQYFCPKNTYDALNTTDTLSVVYQQDSSGGVSIVSISK